MSTSKNSPSWLGSAEKRAKEQLENGNEITNPSAAKDPKKTGSKKKKKSAASDYNYLRILLSKEVEARFRYVTHVLEGRAIKEGTKEPTFGEVFADMLDLYEKKIKP